MDTLLHGKIGRILGKELIRKGYTINIDCFVYGNMRPDLNLKCRMTMHNKKEDWNNVLEIIDELVYAKEKVKYDISIKLGMLSHYICDFFTFPHNEGFGKNIIHHELYEQAQRILWWSKLTTIWEECDNEISFEIKSIKELITYIEDMHIIYMRNPGDKKRDLFFSNILIRVICPSILKIREKQKNLAQVNNVEMLKPCIGII